MLAEFLGGSDPLVWQKVNPFTGSDPNEDWHRMDHCLCPIDLAATLSAGGLSYRRGDDPMQWFLSDDQNADPAGTHAT
jgi:hypothetical protein